jgi:hypothetical protein
VQRIVDWFCEGSVEALLVGMIDSRVLDREELQRVAERIAKSRTANSVTTDAQSNAKKARK